MTDKKTDIWKSRYYTIPRLYLGIAGIWPYHRLRDRCKRFMPMFIFCSSITIPQVIYCTVKELVAYFFSFNNKTPDVLIHSTILIPIYSYIHSTILIPMYVLTASMNLDDLFESIPSVFISILFSFKITTLMFNNKKIKSCLKIIEEDWLSLNTDVEKAILHRHAEHGRYMATFYAVMMNMTAFFYLLKPVILTLLENNNATKSATKISGLSKLPFRVDYSEKLDQYFYPITIHCYLGVFAHVFSTLAVDTLYYTLIQHACGMFSIVGYMLEEIGKDSDISFHLKLNKIQDDNYSKALNCLRRHLHVIQFAELIESTFTKVFLISIILSTIGGSICGIRVIMNLGNIRDVAAPLAIYIAQLTHVFLQFWQAQFLLDYSVVPYESICRGKWYYTSKRCRKIFLLIMNRAMTPCRITAGKIVTLSIESFSTVLKTSVSYFTVLRSFQ